MLLNLSLTLLRALATVLEWAWAVSITRASTPALINALDLFIITLSTPIAAATLSLPKSSLFETDLIECLFISLKVI